MDVPAETLRRALKHQYHAALAMLRCAIEQCPDDIWVSDAYVNPTWRIAYHTLYYAHMHLQPSAHDFTPWEHHQTSIQDLDDIPAPPGIFELIELPHRPPQTGRPYTRLQLIEYWSLVDAMIEPCLDAADLLAPECGFHWYRFNWLELQFMSLRHVQHHTAQIGSRLREDSQGTNSIPWVGSGGKPRQPIP